MQGSRKERFQYYNSLVCLAKALEGYRTLIDLRNEACLTGKIEQVDGFMNIEMSDVTFYNARGATNNILSIILLAIIYSREGVCV